MKFLKYILIIIFMILTYSCNQKNEILKVGTNVWPGYEPIYIAREIGKLDKNIKLIEFGSTSGVLRAYRNGFINGAGLTLDEAIYLKSLGYSPKIIFIADISNGADVLIVKPYIKTLKDLKGKKVGVENTALGAFFLTRILEIAGLDEKDVKVIPLEVNQHYEAFTENKIDAVITFEPVKTKLLKAGGKVLFDSSKIPNEIVDVFVVEESYIKENPKIVQSFVKSWYEGLNYLKNYPFKALKIISEREKISVEEAKKAYKGLILPSKEESYKLMTNKLKITILKLTKIMKKDHLLAENADIKPEDLIDIRFLKGVDKQ